MINYNDDKIHFDIRLTVAVGIIAALSIILIFFSVSELTQPSISRPDPWPLVLNLMLSFFVPVALCGFFFKTEGFVVSFLGVAVIVIFLLFKITALESSAAPVAAYLVLIFVFFAAFNGLAVIRAHDARHIHRDIECRLKESRCNLLEKDRNNAALKTEAYRSKLERFKGLNNVTESLSSTLKLQDTLILILEQCLKAVREGNAIIYMAPSEKTGNRSYYLVRSTYTRDVSRFSTDFFEGHVMNTHYALLVKDLGSDFRFKGGAVLDREVNSIISVPLIENTEIIGVLRMDSHKPRLYTNNELRMLDYIGYAAATAIQNALLFEEMERLAQVDGLTTLYKRWYFMEKIASELTRSSRYGKNFSVAMLDIDNFKQFNDIYGHLIGDQVLHRVAGIVKAKIAPLDTAARYGGEEFIILMPNTSRQKAASRAEAIRGGIEKQSSLQGVEKGITVSIGVATYPDDGEDPKFIIHKADTALYKAKAAGKNQVIC